MSASASIVVSNTAAVQLVLAESTATVAIVRGYGAAGVYRYSYCIGQTKGLNPSQNRVSLWGWSDLDEQGDEQGDSSPRLNSCITV